MKDEERGYNDYEETNSGRLSPSSFRSAFNDVNSIRDRINRRRHNPNSNTPLSNGLDDNPLDKGSDLLPKEGLDKGAEAVKKGTKSAKSVVTTASTAAKTTSLSEGLIAFIVSGGWIVFAVLIGIIIVIIFGIVISNFSMKYGLTGEESYQTLSDTFEEGKSRDEVDSIFSSISDEDACGTLGLGAKIRIAFGKWNLENPEELCLFLKRQLESNESSKNIRPVSPGYLFNALYYGYDSQNLDENGKQYIQMEEVDDDEGKVVDISDFDALSTLIAAKIYGDNSTETIKTIKKLFDNYFYFESYPYVKWEVVGHTAPPEEEPIYACVRHNSTPKYYVDDEKFKLYLRYGDGPDISDNSETKGVAFYYQRDKNDKSSYDNTDRECTGEIASILGREYPNMSKYDAKANLNFEDKEFPKVSVDTGTYGYENGFIYQYYPRYMPEYTISKTNPYVFDYIVPKDIEAIINNISSRQDYTNYILGYPNTVKTTANNPYSFSSGGSNCGYKINDDIVNNLKVRLTYQRSQNSSVNAQRGAEIEGQELVDLEKYIMGVVYAESSSGGAEHVKAQAIAARSYLLGGIQSGTFKLTNENGNNIVTISNSTDDQTYCDPDKGCYKCQDSTYKGNITLLTTGTVPTGSTCTYRGGGLSSDSVIRSASKQVVGQYLVSGNTIKIAGYGSSEQNNWSIWARSGMSYEDILAKQYTDATLSKAQCVFASGEWTKWTQLDSAWASVRIGNKTVREVGCYMTSIAMLVADTAGNYLDGNFNPGTFATKLQAQGQFTSGGALRADIPTSIKIATGNNNLNIETHTIDMAENEPYESKVNKISSYLSQGYHILLRVKSEQSRKEYYEISGHKTWWAYAQHWVYVTGVDGLDIHMADPGSSYEIVRSNPYYLNSGLIRFIAVKINE